MLSKALNEINFDISEKFKDKKELDKIYSNICDVLTSSYQETYDLFHKKIFEPKECLTQNKKFFNYELRIIKDKIMNLKKNFEKNEKTTQEIKTLKKEFRSWQRYSIFLKEKNEYNQLDKISKSKDKNKFWRFINNSRKKRTERRTVTLDSASLFQHFKNLFHDPFLNQSEKDISISSKVRSHLNENKVNILGFFFSI